MARYSTIPPRPAKQRSCIPSTWWGVNSIFSNVASFSVSSQDNHREFDRVAVRMESFHNHFRSQWQLLYDATEVNKIPDDMTTWRFIETGLEFCRRLAGHHDFEEAHIFPKLARKMPAFQESHIMKEQHKEIHSGLTRLQIFLEGCWEGEEDLRLDELKNIMDSFRVVLWDHLDGEVRELGADNMRKYWTLDEMDELL